MFELKTKSVGLTFTSGAGVSLESISIMTSDSSSPEESVSSRISARRVLDISTVRSRMSGFLLGGACIATSSLSASEANCGDFALARLGNGAMSRGRSGRDSS